jgi:SAM-dependent methyltransferase
MRVQDIVRDHFNRDAQRFDAIYASDKTFIQRVVDRFRQVVVERFRLICNLAPIPGPWTALDVGCGSGRYPIAFARNGAARVVGIDVAHAMTSLAAAEAARAGVQDRCEFVTVSFLDFESVERFDAVVAMGYFDYLDDPGPHLQKMIAFSRGRVYASFPKRWDVRVPVRMLRFALARGFVRFYSRANVERLLRGTGIPAAQWSIVDFDRDWIVVLRVTR